MTTINRLNGRLDSEVIMNFGDGCAYSKERMELAIRSSGLFNKPPPKAAKEVHAVKKREDVDLLVNELEISRIEAERALDAAGGDTLKALQAFVFAN